MTVTEDRSTPKIFTNIHQSLGVVAPRVGRKPTTNRFHNYIQLPGRKIDVKTDRFLSVSQQPLQRPG
ncbi:hypothetical protein [Chamaesiphon sp. VAR_48_metabat_135_sub]|uniref:hypothetical protein n=1 Tax=Chamaesiphon sp. VAR_48_metabat_135_sub TaxID=2964699 RepID=UPI00286BD4CC|nr:hypothetical protein [Chamaesiphon sp. VAR_48_metabat_135_sub]